VAMMPRLVSVLVASLTLSLLGCATTDRSPCGAGQTECSGDCAWLSRDRYNCGDAATSAVMNALAAQASVSARQAKSSVTVSAST